MGINTDTNVLEELDGEAAALPPIGIVIPAYGHPCFLSEAIISACAQETKRAIHVVVVDDGCRFEDTASVVANLLPAYQGKLHYVRHKNTRLPGARNKGVSFLLSLAPDLDSIFFLDADNRLSPYSIEAYRAALGDDPRIGWAYPDIAFFGLSRGRSGFEIRETAPIYSPLRHLCGNISEAGSLVRADLFRANIFFDESMRSGFEDWDFWLMALESGFHGARVKDAGFLYRRRAESMLADSRRDVDLLLERIRAKHKPLFEPDNIMRLVQSEAPTFAFMELGGDEVALTADPCADPCVITRSELASLMTACRDSPLEYFFPERIVILAPGVWSNLQSSAKPYLRWIFWKLLQSQESEASFTFAASSALGWAGATLTESPHLLVLNRHSFERYVWATDTGRDLNFATIKHTVINLPGADLRPVSDLAEVAEFGNVISEIRQKLRLAAPVLNHVDRVYGGPDCRNLMKTQIAPLISANRIGIPPVPWVKTLGERWIAFAMKNGERAARRLTEQLLWARGKGYHVLVLLEQITPGGKLDQATLDVLATADMVVPVTLDDGISANRHYMGRIVDAAIGLLGAAEVETLAFHFDYLMASPDAICLEVFGAARHRGTRCFVLFDDVDEVGTCTWLPEKGGRMLAYEHAIDAFVTHARESVAMQLSAQGIPAEKIVSRDMFLANFAQATAKRGVASVETPTMAWSPQEGFLFVVTYGRSGSTLLQTALQTIDGYCIRGENENVLWSLFDAWRRARTMRQRFNTARPIPAHGPWFGADEVAADSFSDRMIDAFIGEIIKPPADARVIGFKEIRYSELAPDELMAFLDFLRTRFNQARIVFNTRRWDEVAQSSWWKHCNADDVRKMVESCDRIFGSYAAKYPQNCHLIRYEEYKNNPAGLKPLFDFLGEPFDAAALASVIGRQLPH